MAKMTSRGLDRVTSDHFLGNGENRYWKKNPIMSLWMGFQLPVKNSSSILSVEKT